MDISKVKGIIFDYGGTIDTGAVHWSEVIWDGYQKSGVAVDKAEFRDAYVYAERELARERHILPEHDFHDLLLIKLRIELNRLAEEGHFAPEDVEAKAGEIAQYCYDFARSNVQAAIPVLEELGKKYPLILVSNFYGNIETVLKDFGIRKYFKDIIESAVVGVRKPDPRIFTKGVEALGLQAGEVLVIGDSFSKDIEPAEKAGCQVLWLKGSVWSAEEDEVFHPDTITRLEDALEILIQK